MRAGPPVAFNSRFLAGHSDSISTTPTSRKASKQPHQCATGEKRSPSGAKEAAEKIKKQIPRGLKPAKDDENRRLGRGPKGQLYPNGEFFRSL